MWLADLLRPWCRNSRKCMPKSPPFCTKAFITYMSKYRLQSQNEWWLVGKLLKNEYLHWFCLVWCYFTCLRSYRAVWLRARSCAKYVGMPCRTGCLHGHSQAPAPLGNCNRMSKAFRLICLWRDRNVVWTTLYVKAISVLSVYISMVLQPSFCFLRNQTFNLTDGVGLQIPIYSKQ